MGSWWFNDTDQTHPLLGGISDEQAVQGLYRQGLHSESLAAPEKDPELRGITQSQIWKIYKQADQKVHL